MSTNPEDLLGTVLRNRYRLERLLSTQGGQATVYYAIDISTPLNNERIVKQFSPNYNDIEMLAIGTRLFNQESEILQKLGKHSQIPQIFDYFELDKSFYLVQELIEGQNLAQEFRAKKQLNESEVIDLLKDTLNVLRFVHQNNYIHRDIKPSNLIRNKHDRKVYLIDFGAVKEKIKPENIDDRGGFAPTVAIGTPGYMPIEQLRGVPKFGSDIYALGMVAIEALTGSHPTKFIDENSNVPVWRNRLPTAAHNCNPSFLNLLDRMVGSNNQERYQSVAEVVQDLERISLPNSENLIPLPQKSQRKDEKTVLTNIPPEPKKSLLPWLVAGISAIALAILGSLFIGNKESYTVYANDEYGIDLERPKNWSVQESWISLQPGVNFLSPLVNQKDSFQERVTVSVEELAQPLTLDEYTAQATAQIKGSNTILEPATTTTFANKEARKVVYRTDDGSKKLMEVWTVKNRKVYIATYIAEANRFNKYKNQAEKIIQSLAINN
ncbi:MAG: serine/threonine-protein kinase [Cyanobacteria bacterium J06631_2]